ncbi:MULTISPECIES: hypothetical protein [Enterobacteriaceae]|uniref:hypothetical protein n=1 Tax=Enterobacteriaceae TaxID=543 RepID=UPI002D7927E5|nr:hypothetical protein [Citrobacter freundii]WRR54882.1 hypothetical protein U9I37_24565 [Citrobacter freundii]
MTNSKPFILSALLCLTFTVGMISYLLISDVPEKIRILNQKITASTYPQSRDVLNKDMAEIILPYLKKQKAAEASQVKVQKPNESIRRNNCSNQEATNEKEHFELSYIWNSAHGYGKHGCIFYLPNR